MIPIRLAAPERTSAPRRRSATSPGRSSWRSFRAADTHPEFAAELPAFVAAVKEMFSPAVSREYFERVRRVGPLGHVASDDEVELMRDSDLLDEDVVAGAAEIRLVEKVKEMQLP